MARTKQAEKKIGNRYSMLEVIGVFYKKNKNGKNKVWFDCKCDCGKICQVAGSNLRKNNGTKSCGCNRWYGNRAVDLTGQKFGHLTALNATELRLRKNIVWSFQCDCGNIKNLPAGEVVSLKTTSCGCRRKNLDREDQAWRNAFRRSLKLSDSYGDCDLDFDFFKETVSKNCFYCNKPPRTPVRDGKIIIGYRVGMDRIDSNLGYLKNNIVPCCEICNRAKSDKTIYEWIDHVNSVYKYFIESDRFKILFN